MCLYMFKTEFTSQVAVPGESNDSTYFDPIEACRCRCPLELGRPRLRGLSYLRRTDDVDDDDDDIQLNDGWNEQTPRGCKRGARSGKE